MAIATWSRRDAAQVSVPENAFPNWGMALKAQKVDIDWIADIMASPIADMTLKTRRVGVLVRADGPNLWWGQLPCMIRFNVPIWIYWGTIEVPRNTPHATPAMLAHKPSMDDIKNADYLMSETGGRDGHPLVEGGGGQLYGETWKEMFARRSVEDETLRAEETPLQMEARLRRKELSLLCKAPGLQCRGVTVFEWVECPEPRYRGEFVRYRVSRWQVGDVWDRYTDAQKRYDDYRNEWDLCRQFDSDDMDDQLYPETSQDTSFIDHRALLPSLPPSAESCNDVTRQAHVAYSVPHITDPPRPALSEEILRNRYGLILPADASYELRSQPPLSQAKLEKLFGFCPKSLPLTLRNPLSDFAIGLMRNADFLSTMWDLRARNGSCIKTKTSTHVSRYLRLSVDGSRGEVYRVEGQGTGPAHWELIVEDPVSVMQLLRLRGPQSTQYLFQHLYGLWHEYEGRGIGGDDALSEEEEGIICGLYKVYTDDSGRQTEDASWWPKQSVWKRCGLYVGYWSEDCERWFQLRLQGIKSCKEQPKNAAAWKDALKYYQNDSRTILAQLSRGASNFLA
ncbi:hypothetical protein EUX98_g8703 [Antrodiella citrinella]|uniref:Uncharacterized protein n=1 Tax=Antrodiella citrinella TaxID=2447956 RepID=A0A4S4M408_9APHY|nr:hypothetical protein EUX98_g8703 [Antrodiella citrinella]